MTSRDLIQQRTTLSNGDTVWRYSPLVEAALRGKLAVLDGINRIHHSTLSILHRYAIRFRESLKQTQATCSIFFQIGTRPRATVARWQETRRNRPLRRDKERIQ